MLRIVALTFFFIETLGSRVPVSKGGTNLSFRDAKNTTKSATAPLPKANASESSNSTASPSAKVLSKAASTINDTVTMATPTKASAKRLRRTAPEALLDMQMEKALRDSTALESDLQNVRATEKVVTQQTDAIRIERHQLEFQIGEAHKKLQAQAKIVAEKASLAAEAERLSMALEQQRQETTRQQSISSSLSRKVAVLENDIRVLSKSWKEVTQHQAAMVAALRTQVIDAQLAKQAEQAAKRVVTKHHVSRSDVINQKAKQLKAKEVTEDAEEDDDTDDDEELGDDDNSEDEDDTV
jgi:hypothetical protein